MLILKEIFFEFFIEGLVTIFIKNNKIQSCV